MTMTDQQEDLYQCVGICMADPDSGYCLGCGRPPLESPSIVAEAVKPTTATPRPAGGNPDPDTPA
jgi:uncharacterized protein